MPENNKKQPTPQQSLILQALGESAKVFMKNKKPGTEQVMPEAELSKIADLLDSQLGSRYKVDQVTKGGEWHIFENTNGELWDNISRGYPHATSAYAALGRMVSQENKLLQEIAEGKLDTPDSKPE